MILINEFKNTKGGVVMKYLKKSGIVKLSLIMFLTLANSSISNADPHEGQSLNVVIIGGSTLSTTTPCSYGYTNANSMDYTGGGCLPVTGPVGELGDFNFSPMHPSTVNAASLAPFDTAVLNVASYAMRCNTNTLNLQQQVELIAWVAAGHKLIIYDSECYPGPVDYSWLPFPFSTANPGAMGAQGTLTIVEDNTLSTDTQDPDCSEGDMHCINAVYLSNYTDAIGDMNVMTTYDPHWFLDMAGTNFLGITGPVHAYSNLPAGTDDGLIIYNGLDVDYLVINESNLRKIWVQELQQEFSPADLPSSVAVIGITVTPVMATNIVGETHTLTATLTDQKGIPQENIFVTFSIISGPNQGVVGVCNPNVDCSSNESGIVEFSYIGSGGEGVDEIEACFVNDQGVQLCSQGAKEWIMPSLCGDLDGNLVVDGIDRNILRSAFGKNAGASGYIADADYDLDGDIDYSDYQLWYKCYQEYLTQ